MKKLIGIGLVLSFVLACTSCVLYLYKLCKQCTAVKTVGSVVFYDAAQKICAKVLPCLKRFTMARLHVLYCLNNRAAASASA